MISKAQSGKPWLLVLAIGLYLIVPSLIPLTHNSQATVDRLDTDEAREERNSGAFAVMLGEFRTNLSDLIFIKTERYLDSGIAYMPHIDAEEMAKSGEVHQKGTTSGTLSSQAYQAIGTSSTVHAEDEHHEENVPTIIKTASQDFRGFIGNLQREVKPWQDPSKPHEHTGGTQLLPWYRLATLSDPRNVRNYMIGAWWLKTIRTDQQTSEALKFLNEGIMNNPDAYQLYLMRGYVEMQMNDHDTALKDFEKSADLVKKVRPKGGVLTKDWDQTDEEQGQAAISMAAGLIRDKKGAAAAYSYLDQFDSYYPPPSFLARARYSIKIADDLETSATAASKSTSRTLQNRSTETTSSSVHGH